MKYTNKEETYEVSREIYKLYHMIFLLANKLKSENKPDDNLFWIKEIEKEINNNNLKQ